MIFNIKLTAWFIIVCFVTLFCCTCICHAQDSSSVNLPATWNGAIASKPVSYSPNKAYNGFTHVSKMKCLQINVTSEIVGYAKRDTSIHSIPFPMGTAYFYLDSTLTQKEQAWICSLDTHMKYKMRLNTTIDTLCK